MKQASYLIGGIAIGFGLALLTFTGESGEDRAEWCVENGFIEPRNEVQIIN